MRAWRTILVCGGITSVVISQDAPAKPDTPEQAADRVLAALVAKDDTALKALAQRDSPDPWLVADELYAKSQHDAAEAFARAAPRADVEKLPQYVAGRRREPAEPALHEALAQASAALGAGRPDDALVALDAVRRDGADVIAVRLEFARAFALRAAGRLEESAASFRGAAHAASGIGWLARTAASLHESGYSAYLRSDFRGALDAWEARLAVEERRGNRAGVAGTLGNIGIIHMSLGSYPKALEFYERALALSEELGDRPGVATTLGNIGTIHWNLGAYAKALEYQERALKLKEELGDRAGVALTLGNIGLIQDSLGSYSKALEFYQRALALSEELGDRAGAARTLGNIGNTHTRLGDYAKALEYQERALNLREELGDRASVARALGGIGIIHASLGDYAKALEYQERALALAEELGDRLGVAATFGNIGTVQWNLGAYAKALEFQQRALTLGEELGDRAGVATALGNIGAIHERLGAYAKALEYQERSLALREELGDRANIALALGNVGVVHGCLGDHAKALEFYERALALSEELGDRAGAARTLGNIGTIHEQLGDYAKALEFHERALRAAEEIGVVDTAVRNLWGIAGTERTAGRPREAVTAARDAVGRMATLVGGVGDDAAATARSVFAGVFDVGTAAARELADPAEAVFFVESGRAGALLEALQGRECLRETLPAALAEADRAARARQTETARALRRAVESGDLAASRSARAALDGAQKAVLDVQDRIQREAKAVASLAYPKADSLDAIRVRLREGEALVLYRLLDAELGGSVALVVTAASARIVVLAKREDIEAACAALAVEKIDADPAGSVAALRKVVVEPLALESKTKRLLVSPDGALSYVPFALLASDREVCFVPSGTTYGLLREEEAKKGDGVLALGDPDYGVQSAAATAALALRGGAGLARLPATAAEARAVGDVVLLGKDATEAGLAAALAKRPRWRAVHLACHGLVDPERPLLSSLALTPSGGDDGFLTALEVFRLKCPTDLVVLSACETGKGKVYQAEGIVGLTRAFMFAGAPRVLVSVWKVDDQATAALMERFYGAWRKGVPTARALREAQDFVKGQEKWKHPSYWAAWQLWGLPD